MGYLNNTSYNKKGVLAGILDECSYDELELIYKKSPSIYKGLLSLSYLRRSSYSEIYRGGVQPRRDVKEYIGVLAYVINRNKELINKYVEYKRLVDCAVLTGDYDKARQFIKWINKNISYSYWAGSYMIKIERLDKGLTPCSKLYNKLFGENNTIVQCVYYCAFRSSSLDFLLDDVKRVLWPKESNDSEFINNYFVSHCMQYLGYEEGEWMCTDMNSSIVDLYNNLLAFLPKLSAETLRDTEVRKCLAVLCSQINDDYLKKMCYLYGIVQDSILDRERISIIEVYAQSEYGKVVDKSLPYLENKPDDFEIYSLYLKSLLQEGGSFEQPQNESNIIKKIGYHYFEIIAHKPNQSFHKRRLANICRSQYHIQGVRYMLTLVEGIETDDIYRLYENTWQCLPYSSPFDVCYFQGQDERLEHIRNIVGDSSLWEKVFGESQSSLSDECLELSLAGIGADKAFPSLVKNFTDNKIVPYLRDVVATFIFNHYILRKEYQEAVRFYVESRLDDNALTIGLGDKDVILALLEDKEISQQIPLDLAIFAEMIDADADTIYFIYKKYLKHCGVQRASEMVIDGGLKQRYFLENVAVIKVLTLHVLRFKSVKQVMEERSAICSNLYDYYQSKKINDEISSICRDIKIMELNNQVDESKIYVDVKSIKEKESGEAKELYDMFANASNQVAYRDIVFGEIVNYLKSSGMKTTLAEIDEKGVLKEASGKMELVNYRKDVLTQIFLTIRDQFLFNPKYGLDNYLSTRIRHGTLVNQLRNHFEERNLVTNTVNGNYSNNEYWVGSSFKLRDNRTLQCIQLFSEFSRGIDSIITDIKDSYVQVKTENHNEKENGCFDFDRIYFEDDIDRLLVNTSLNNFDVCFDLILECLWQRAERGLESIREKLIEAQTEMISKLHSLQRNVINVIGSDNIGISAFNDAVSYCQNGIQNDFQIVTKWFKRSNYVDFDFTIGQVIETSIGFINRNNKNMLKTTVSDKSTTTFQGRYFGTLYDIFHDILNNALDYAKRSHVKGDCSISTSEAHDYLHIRVGNPIRKEDIGTLKTKIEEINSKLEEKIYTGKSRDEGNSGCSKICNAVKYHLGSAGNTYINTIEQDMFVVQVDIDLNPIKK